MDGRMTSLDRANSPRAARIRRPGGERVVWSLAMRQTYRVYRRQVNDVEAQPLDLREAPDAIVESAVSVGQLPLRARKELVPGRPARSRAVDHDLELVVVASPIARRVRAGDGAAQRGIEEEVETGLLVLCGVRALEDEAEPGSLTSCGTRSGLTHELQPLQELALEIGLPGRLPALDLR